MVVLEELIEKEFLRTTSKKEKLKDWHLNALFQRKNVLFGVMLVLSPDHTTEIRSVKL